jgi:flavin-dependent dehydrogenase
MLVSERKGYRHLAVVGIILPPGLIQAPTMSSQHPRLIGHIVAKEKVNTSSEGVASDSLDGVHMPGNVAMAWLITLDGGLARVGSADCGRSRKWGRRRMGRALPRFRRRMFTRQITSHADLPLPSLE